jgi:hypothetical protein
MEKFSSVILVFVMLFLSACRNSKEEASSHPNQANVPTGPSSQDQLQPDGQPGNTAESKPEKNPPKGSSAPGQCDSKIAKGLYCRPATSPKNADFQYEASACLTVHENGELTAVTKTGAVEKCPPDISCEENADEAAPYLLFIGKGLSVPMGSAVECGENERQLIYDFVNLK